MDPAVVSLPMPGIDVSKSRRQLAGRDSIIKKCCANLALNLRDLFVERGEDFPD